MIEKGEQVLSEPGVSLAIYSNALSTAALGRPPQAYEAKALGGDAGRLEKRVGDNALAQYDILFNRRLPVATMSSGHFALNKFPS